MKKQELECRATLFSKAFGILLTSYGGYHLIASYGTYSLAEWIVLLCFPLLLAISCFVMPTLRITFREEGIFATWKIGGGSVVLYEKRISIPWPTVRAVRELSPSFLPPHVLLIEGYPTPSDTWYNSPLISFGTLFTHADEGFVYLGANVHPNMLDRSTRKLIERAKKRVGNKSGSLSI